MRRWEINKYLLLVLGTHFFLTCWWENWIFTGNWWDSFFSWLTVKCCTLFVIACFWQMIFRAYFDKYGRCRRILLYSLPYACLLFSFFFFQVIFKMNGAYMPTGDQLRIFTAVQSYNLFPEHFLYPTGLFTAIGMQLIPTYFGAVIWHIIFQSLVCGYCVDKLKTKWMYVLFLLLPVLMNGVMFHRMQTYGLLYLILFVKCYADYKVKKDWTIKDFISISVICAILSFWRREGFYLIFVGFIILATTYRFHKACLWKKLLIYGIIFGIVLLPEIYHDAGKDSANGESKLVYAIAFTQMDRMGLDESKYPEQMAAIEQHFNMPLVKGINSILGTRANGDAYLAWGVKGLVESFPDLDFPNEIFDGRKYAALKHNVNEVDDEFIKSVVYIIIHEPLIFIQSRLSIFHTASMNGNMSNGWYYWAKAFFWNLYLPLLFISISLIQNIRKYHLSSPLVWLEVGLLIHTIITMFVSPCGYFKYYYHVYLIGWAIFFIWLAKFLKERRIMRES